MMNQTPFELDEWFSTSTYIGRGSVHDSPNEDGIAIAPCGELIVADRYYPSSKTCSHCTTINDTLRREQKRWTWLTLILEGKPHRIDKTTPGFEDVLSMIRGGRQESELLVFMHESGIIQEPADKSRAGRTSVNTDYEQTLKHVALQVQGLTAQQIVGRTTVSPAQRELDAESQSLPRLLTDTQLEYLNDLSSKLRGGKELVALYALDGDLTTSVLEEIQKIAVEQGVARDMVPSERPHADQTRDTSTEANL